MAHNLTESASYFANVSVPDGGDARTAASVETPFQSLANRTKYLKARTDALGQYARFRIEAPSPGVASGSKLTLANPNLGAVNNDFVLASNEITVPEAGIYLVSAILRLTCSSATEPLTMKCLITAGTSPDAFESNALQLAANRTTDGHPEYASVTGIIVITDPATEKIKILSVNNNIVVDDALVESHRSLSIWRLV